MRAKPRNGYLNKCLWLACGFLFFVRPPVKISPFYVNTIKNGLGCQCESLQNAQHAKCDLECDLCYLFFNCLL